MSVLTAERLDRARVRLLDHQPYLADTALRLRWVARPGIGTTAVALNGTCYFDPAFVVSDAHLPGVLEHECGHLYLAHFARRGVREPLAWNIAGDCEINERLMHGLPPGALMPPPPGRLTAEEYYRPATGPCACCAGGSGAGRPLPDELVTPGDVAAADLAATVTVAAIRAAAGRGDATAQRIVGALPVVPPRPPDWREVLRRCLARVAGEASVRTYARGRMRGGVVTPRAMRHAVRVSVLADCSGSIGDVELGAVVAVLRRSPLAEECRVYWGTTRVVAVQPLCAVRQPEESGGTDMRACAEAIPPGPLVLLTDGDTPWPDRPCWVVLTRAGVAVPAPHTHIGTLGGAA